MNKHDWSLISAERYEKKEKEPSFLFQVLLVLLMVSSVLLACFI